MAVSTSEQLPLEAPSREQFGWGMVDVGSERFAKASVHWERKEKARRNTFILSRVIDSKYGNIIEAMYPPD